MLGIIGAMEEEVAALKVLMTDVEETEKAGMTFCKGKLGGKDTVVVRSGIGKVNMAVCTQILVDLYEVTALINTGVAGSLRNEINIGDMVLSTDALQHDMDVSGLGHEPGEIPRMDTSIFEADQELVNLAEQVCQEVNLDIQVFRGRVVSGDQFISDGERKNVLCEHFDGFCAEMEGAAMAHAAYLNQVPYLVIRAISDKADNSAQMNYEEFEKQAIVHTMRLVLALVEKIK